MRFARIVMCSALIVAILPLAAHAQAASGPRCEDGTRGEPGYTACWFHGGVAAASMPPASRATPARSLAAKAEPSSTRKPHKVAKPAKKTKAKVARTSKAPKGATALCKDGTYTDNKKTKKGCKKHKGVARSLQPSAKA